MSDELVPYSGAGNTFFLFDNRGKKSAAERLLPEIGNADGLICVESAPNADALMRIFNRDGSEAEMCGNGLRCLIHFLKELGLQRDVYQIETLAGRHEGWLDSEGVCIRMPSPSQLKLNVEKGIHFLNTGVPHAVLFEESIEDIPVDLRGRELRRSPLFAPAGANVNFASLRDGSSVTLRTFERGVEAETLACGTGAVATALIAHKIYGLPSPITVWVRSGDKLKITFNTEWSEITLQGPVKKLERKESILNNITL